MCRTDGEEYRAPDSSGITRSQLVTWEQRWLFSVGSIQKTFCGRPWLASHPTAMSGPIMVTSRLSLDCGLIPSARGWDLFPKHLIEELGWTEKDSNKMKLVRKVARCPGNCLRMSREALQGQEGNSGTASTLSTTALITWNIWMPACKCLLKLFNIPSTFVAPNKSRLNSQRPIMWPQFKETRPTVFIHSFTCPFILQAFVECLQPALGHKLIISWVSLMMSLINLHGLPVPEGRVRTGKPGHRGFSHPAQPCSLTSVLTALTGKFLCRPLCFCLPFAMAKQVKNPLAMQETQEMRGLSLVGKIPWRKKWQPTLLFLPEKSYGQRSLVCYSPKDCTESNMTWVTKTRVCAFGNSVLECSPLVSPQLPLKTPQGRRLHCLVSEAWVPVFTCREGSVIALRRWGLSALDDGLSLELDPLGTLDCVSPWAPSWLSVVFDSGFSQRIHWFTNNLKNC